MPKTIKRLWLNGVGLFEIIPNSGKGSCLFQAISQALTFTSRFHYKIRTATVDHMTSKKWERRLKDLPDFWKHKIIRLWLRNERTHFLQRRIFLQQQSIKNFRNKVGTEAALCESYENAKGCGCGCYRRLDDFIERRRHKKYFKMKKLLETNNNNTYMFLDSFKLIFHQFMSQRNEPGTKFELEAAAHLFRFHFDYLQMLPPSKVQSRQVNIASSPADEDQIPFLKKMKITPSDILNQNFSISKTSNLDLRSCEDMKDDNDDDDDDEGTQDNLKITNESITLSGTMYQFFSCRNNCKLARGLAPEPFDHYFFMHSPKASFDKYGGTWDRYGLSSSSGLTSHECGHWELLLPISIKKHPVPLNRRIFGLSYEITDSTRRFIMTRCGQKREIPDNVARAIDCYVKENPNIIPPEDPQWPPDDTDDYIGCAASLMRDSYYQSKFATGIGPKALKKPNHNDECCWWHSTTRNISHREDILNNNLPDEEEDQKSGEKKKKKKKKHLHYHFYTDNLTGRTLVIYDKSTFLNRVRYWRSVHFRSLSSTLLFARSKLGKWGKRNKKKKSSSDNDDDVSSSDF